MPKKKVARKKKSTATSVKRVAKKKVASKVDRGELSMVPSGTKKKAAKKKVTTKKTTKKRVRDTDHDDQAPPLEDSTLDVIERANTRTPKVRLAFALGEKVYLNPGKICTRICRVVLSTEGIRYQCAVGSWVPAEMLSSAVGHELRGLPK